MLDDSDVYTLEWNCVSHFFSCSICIHGIMILSNVMLCPLRKLCIDSSKDVCMLELICLTLTSLIGFWYYTWANILWFHPQFLSVLCDLVFNQIIQNRYQKFHDSIFWRSHQIFCWSVMWIFIHSLLPWPQTRLFTNLGIECRLLYAYKRRK